MLDNLKQRLPLLPLAAVSAVALLAACSEADISSPGDTGQVDDGGGDDGTDGGDGGDGGNGDDGGDGGNGGDDGPSCPDFASEGDPVGGNTSCVLTGTLTQDRTLSSDVFWRLEGEVEVGVDVGGGGEAADGDPAILEIEPGTTIFGESGSDFLVVNRGSELVADGTRDNPIVMTSRSDLEDQNPQRGDWGGLILLGRAPISSCSGASPGEADCENNVEGTDALYGGDAPGDDSGVLNFLQVRFTGDVISEGNEIQAITLGAVGSATEIDFVQTHNSLDDGIELFGGTVDLKHTVYTGIADDSIDWSEGWTGNLQFGLIDQAPEAGDRGIEAGNSSLPPGIDERRSDPTVANLTILGDENAGEGLLLRGGTDGQIVNTIATGSSECLDIDAQSTFDANPTFQSVLLDCATTFVDDSADGGETASEVESVFNDGGQDNVTDEATRLQAPFQGGDAFINGSTEDGVPAVDPTSFGGFFESVDWIGAVRDESDNWWRTWSCGLEANSEC